jgi:hypothetical protein
MCFIGQVRDGVYIDDCEGVHPDVIDRYYGVHGPGTRRAPGQTGAGQLDDEDIPIPQSDSEGGESDSHLEEQIEDAQAHNFHHEAVPVPKHAPPFDDDETMQLFYDTLLAAHDHGIIPPGYGLRPEEWDEGGYPTFEILKSGRRGGRELRVALPDSIWRPRAELWGRALAILNEITYANET